MIKVIDIPIYRCSVVFMIDTTKDEYMAFYEEQKNCFTPRDHHIILNEYKEAPLGFVIGTEGNDYVMQVTDKNNKGLVAHEIFHAANMLLFDKGYTPDGASEPTAYLLEFLTNEFYKAIEE